MDEKILLYGGKSQALMVLERLREEQGRDVAYIFDSMLERPYFPFDGAFGNDKETLAKFLAEATDFLVCVGGEHGFARVKISETLKGRFGLRPVDLISPDAIITASANCGEGTQIMPRALLEPHSRIGDYTMLDPHCNVGHECVVGKGVHIMAGAVVTGRGIVEDFATVGTNACIIPDVKVGEAAYIGAGAVVLNDVPPYTVVVGNPARKLRTHEPICDMSILDEI